MADSPNHYEVLGLSEDASQGDVKSAFRREAIRQHPDKGGNPAMFRMVEEAYEVLISPERRANYDAQLRGGTPTPPGGVDMSDYSDDWSDDAWVGQEAEAKGNTGAKPDGPAPVFVAGPNLPEGGMPEWFPGGKIKRRFVVAAIALWVGLSLALTGQLIPGFSNGSVAVALFWAVVAFFLGSLILRLMAWLLLIFALVMMYTGEADLVTTVVRCTFAFGLWLAGQWFYTFRRGRWHSMLAARILSRLPARLRPTWRWRYGT